MLNQDYLDQLFGHQCSEHISAVTYDQTSTMAAYYYSTASDYTHVSL